MNRRKMLTGAAMITLPGMARARGWDKAGLEQAARLMDSFVADGRVQGASILVKRIDADGMDVFSRNFGTAKGTEPIFLLASITKPMAAAVVMTLVDEGKLSLDDTVTKFFPVFTGDGRETITVRNLLTHTGGLPDMLANDEMLREEKAGLDVFRDGALKAPLKFKPGTSYSYASMGILLASAIAEKVTGKPIADLADERLFKPLKMTRTSFGLRGRPNSQAVPSQPAPAMTPAGKLSWQNWNWNSEYWRNLGAPWGGALGSAADIVKFYDEFLNKRGKVVKPATAGLMITNQSPPGVRASGLGFDLPPAVGSPGCSARTFGHNGSTGTLSWADPENGVTCVVLTTLYESAMRPHPTHQVSDKISEALHKG